LRRLQSKFSDSSEFLKGSRPSAGFPLFFQYG
jgi:hypothetical protein